MSTATTPPPARPAAAVPTVTLANGVVVYAKQYPAGLDSCVYVNKAAAATRAATLGVGWAAYHHVGREYYAARLETLPATPDRAARRRAFVRALAEFLAGNAADKSVRLEMGQPLAREWAALRGTTPLAGYPPVDEAEATLAAFLGIDLTAGT